MEENKNPTPRQESDHHNQVTDGEHRARRRGHRGGKKHNKHRTDIANVKSDAPTATEQEVPANKQAPVEAAKSDKKNDRRGNKKEHFRHHGANTRDHITQSNDIYGNPNEEKELAEWRAKIVLNAQPTTPPTDESLPVSGKTDLSDSPTISSSAGAIEEQVEVVGVRFRSVGKMYYFAPNGACVKKGDFVIVETARGPEFGDVYLGNTMVKASETVSPLRPLLRIATAEDIAHNAKNREKEQEALVICQKKIAEHKLDMKLIDVQYAFDNSKLLFYFSSEGRVDFRELVKDLASVFHTRIELRQIGIRDEAKLLGGLGACGRALCCTTFLPDFAQVSIKMAKEQGLSLNSAKISGMCGRLMCCLRFESEVYTAEQRLTPAINSTVKTEDGIGTVISTNPLAGTVRVLLKDSPDAPPKQYHRSNVTVLSKERPRQNAESADTPE